MMAVPTMACYQCITANDNNIAKCIGAPACVADTFTPEIMGAGMTTIVNTICQGLCTDSCSENDIFVIEEKQALLDGGCTTRGTPVASTCPPPPAPPEDPAPAPTDPAPAPTPATPSPDSTSPDVDECQQDGVCAPGEVCTNTDGSYLCAADPCADIEAVCVESDLVFLDGFDYSALSPGCVCCFDVRSVGCLLDVLPPADLCVNPGGGMNRNGETIARPAHCWCRGYDCGDLLYDQDLCTANGYYWESAEQCSNAVGFQPILPTIEDQDMTSAWWLGVFGENCCQMDTDGTPYHVLAGEGSCNDTDVAIYVSVSPARRSATLWCCRRMPALRWSSVLQW